MSATGKPNLAWRMLALASLAQNSAFGLSFGTYSTAITDLQMQMDTTRALAGGALGLLVLSYSLCSPLIGMVLRRLSIRYALVLGSALLALGYLLVAMAGSIYQILAIFALVIGPGTALMGVIAPSTLVSRWFVRNRGKMLGITHMSLLMFIAPPIGSLITAAYGPSTLFLCIAGTFAVLAPVFLLVIDSPEDVGLKPMGYAEAVSVRSGSAPAEEARLLPTRSIIGRADYWILNLGVALLGAGAGTFSTHIVPIAMEKGLSPHEGALLMSASGGAGVVGGILLGMLADRVGPIRVLAINAMAVSALWFGMAVSDSFVVLLFLCGLIGACLGTTVIGLLAASLSQLFGPQNLDRAMGYSYLIKLPLIFSAAPITGHLFDVNGAYHAAIMLHVVAFAAASLMFVAIVFVVRPGRPAGAASAIDQTGAGDSPCADKVGDHDPAEAPVR